MDAFRASTRTFTIIVLAILLMLAMGCQRQRHPLNVVIIGVDTLRPDHLGCYGYERETSPAIDRLAAGGVVFENVYSQSPWTLPSFATIFTSLYPMQHGASDPNTKLRTEHPTLPMMLLKRGYSTAAIINAPFLSPEYRLDRGFEYYHYRGPFAGRVASGTTTDALAWIDKHIDEPFFIFVHYFDPHIPYAPPEPYDRAFFPDYDGDLSCPFSLSLALRPRITTFSLNLQGPAHTASRKTMSTLSPDDWDYIRALYDGEIAFTDEAVGALLDGLDERGLRDNTLIFFLSDHGEEFYEHEGFEHGHTLYDEVIKVPLIISLPGHVPENIRVAEHVRLIDVAPTVLDYLDVEPSTHLEGASIKPLISGDGSAVAAEGSLLPPGITYSESMLYGTERKCVLAYPWKYIYDTVTAERMLFNLTADAEEKDNIADAEPDALKPVEELLVKTMFSGSETWFIEISGGGQEHTFDFQARSRSKNMHLVRAFDSEGRMLDAGSIAQMDVSPAGIAVTGLKLSTNLTIAFKLRDRKEEIHFDLALDGDTVIEPVYLGQDLVNPASMPFTVSRQKDQRLPPGTPEDRPEGPYFLIWRSSGGPGEETTFELSEDIEKELRSVGYLQ
jgi:arylsulfatase A-like enzyme